MSNPDGIARRSPLPNEEFAAAWDSIKLASGVRERLLAQALLSITVRQKLPFEIAPLHGFILLMGPPGTGKTMFARGLANQIAKQLPQAKSTYAEVDPHALASSSLGHSQQAVAKLFEQTIPELAIKGVAIVLIDEIETLAVDRQKLSFDANPADVHRATDAALSGMDRLAREHKNVLLIATTNFPKALDKALLSRADYIEEFSLPSLAARRDMILETLKGIAGIWKDVKELADDVERLAKSADGLDGRRIRKAIFAAAASDIETAKDLNRLRSAQIQAAFSEALKTNKELEQ